MSTSNNSCNLIVATMLGFCSLLAFSINFFVFRYPGNCYFPANTAMILIALGLIYAGLYLYYGRLSKITGILKEVLYFFICMCLLVFTTTAAQYTPFSPIDKQIVTIETAWHIHLQEILAWTQAHLTFKCVLTLAYNSLDWQLCYIPLFVIATRRFSLVREYYFLLLSSALIGFTFYYFFPTTAPASIIDSPFFSSEQHDTALKFNQIHHYITPTTMAGGMIALPSFHTIWAWFCLYLLRGWPILFAVMLPVNFLIVMACVMLGWHYTIDIMGSFLVIVMAHSLYYFGVKGAKIKASKGAQKIKGVRPL